jgi:hypothetical protein
MEQTVSLVHTYIPCASNGVDISDRPVMFFNPSPVFSCKLNMNKIEPTSGDYMTLHHDNCKLTELT